MTNDLQNSFPSMWEEWLREVLSSKALTVFEPEKESLRNIRIGQARFVSGKLGKTPHDTFVEFREGYGRHTTLAGIWMFLEKDHPKEYLVTAFGKRKGRGLNRPAQFYGLHISHGSEHQVSLSPLCIDYLQKHVAGIANAEILVCHNHPRNFVADLLSQFIYWSPLPSNADRATMWDFKHRTIVNWPITGSFRNIRFFLVENRALREICLPPVARIAEFLERLRTQAATS